MPRSSLTFKPALWALSLTGTLLAGCSQPPVRPCPPPVVVPPAKPRVSPELMVPPEHSQVDRLLLSLGCSPVPLGSAPTPSSGYQLCKPN